MRTGLSAWFQSVFRGKPSSAKLLDITETRLASLEHLGESLSYRFQDMALLNQALTHRSFVHENQTLGYSDNERLEFLGDAVLQLCISDLLMKKYPDYTEGLLSKFRASFVNEKPLAELARKYRIGDYLLLGRGEENSGGREKPSLLSNTMEAMIAAVYLDGGFAEAFIFVERLFDPLLNESPHAPSYEDYKTALQEFSQGRFKETPKYSLIGEFGPDHDKTFEMQMSLADLITTTGRGRNKKLAEQEAACKALEQLRDMEAR